MNAVGPIAVIARLRPSRQAGKLLRLRHGREPAGLSAPEPVPGVQAKRCSLKTIRLRLDENERFLRPRLISMAAERSSVACGSP